MIHLLSSFRHYHRHLDPIWWALPDELRGDVLDPRHPRLHKIPRRDIVMIGGAVDIHTEVTQVYVEHGAGQSYIDADPKAQPYYNGGKHPANVIGYVCPSWRVAAAWRGKPSVVVGCPALDSHWSRGVNGVPTRRTIAITFHWNGSRVCPEAGSALDHYIDDLPTIQRWARDRDHFFIAHAHPRDVTAPDMWKRLGVEFVSDVDEVLARASVLIADNTSVLYEAAALGIKTMVLNAPWYRRNVHHGLRFWDAVPGPQYEDAYEVVATTPTSRDGFKRGPAVEAAYSLPPGSDGAKTAARFIEDLAATL